MGKKYSVIVFGKSGCPKCKVLNDRIDALLEQEEWGDFEKQYVSLDSEDGLVRFCRSECINPQRLPAFYVARRKDDGSLEPLLPAHEDADRTPTAAARLYGLVGLQTDYSAQGRGVISPRMIKSVLEESRGYER